MKIETAEIVHIYPTEVWYEKDIMGTVHLKMQHMAPDSQPFTFININYDYAYTSNSHQHALVQKIAELLGYEDIKQREWVMPEEWKKAFKGAGDEKDIL